MEQPEEAAAKAEAERGAGFGLEGEAGVVEAQAADAFAQLFEVSTGYEITCADTLLGA